ncbi:MAG: UDP-N-acetylmuramate dehydrogenase [Algoriphagus sp.]|jgi:UDP-N-acetylmuramate dehydrogenase
MPNILKNTSLKAFNTFGLEASAKYFTEINSVTQLLEVIENDVFKENHLMIIGGGSNILLTKNFDGLVVKNNILGIEQTSTNEDEVILKVGSGESWHSLVLYAVKKGLGGIENLSLIPGSVGAAPMQNIGAYGVEIKDVFVSLEALNLKSKKRTSFNHASCEFGYRESIFKHAEKGNYFISHVFFRLQKKPRLKLDYGAIKDTLKEHNIEQPTIKDVSDAVIKIRQSKLPDPAKIGNSGSFFKNPVISLIQFNELKKAYPEIPSYPVDKSHVKVPAGWLIEQAGWKGKTFGQIGVHKNQALVLVNYGGGNGAEIKALSENIQTSVTEKFGIILQAEVNII